MITGPLTGRPYFYATAMWNSWVEQAVSFLLAPCDDIRKLLVGSICSGFPFLSYFQASYIVCWLCFHIMMLDISIIFSNKYSLTAIDKLVEVETDSSLFGCIERIEKVPATTIWQTTTFQQTFGCRSNNCSLWPIATIQQNMRNAGVGKKHLWSIITGNFNEFPLSCWR